MRKDVQTIYWKRLEARRLKQSGLTYYQAAGGVDCSEGRAQTLCHKGNYGMVGKFRCARCGNMAELCRHTQNYLTCRTIKVCNRCHMSIHQNKLKRKHFKRDTILIPTVPNGWRLVRRGWYTKTGDRYWCNSIKHGKCWVPTLFTGYEFGGQRLYDCHKEKPLIYIRRSDKITAAKP